MGITNSTQLYELFLAGGLGFLLGAFYDVFRVLRLMLKPSAVAVFVQDVIFFLFSGVVTFLFALGITGGELRFYLFLGLLIGFLAYYFTIGRAVMRCASGIIAAILFLWRWFWKAAAFPFRLLGRLFRRPFGFLKRLLRGLWDAAEKNVKKPLTFLKKRLHRPRPVLYNQKEYKTFRFR